MSIVNRYIASVALSFWQCQTLGKPPLEGWEWRFHLSEMPVERQESAQQLNRWCLRRPLQGAPMNSNDEKLLAPSITFENKFIMSLF